MVQNMFHKIKIRLTFICTCSTTFLVLIIILCCLKVSEDNMYGQEQALFLLRANTITSDLHSLEEVSIHWYTKNMNQKDILWLELNGVPSALASVVVKGEKLSAVRELKTYLKSDITLPEPEHVSMEASQRRFSWTFEGGGRYLVMQAWISAGTQKAEYLYLYSLEDLFSRIQKQRIRFLAIWVFSAAALSVFSYFFTARALQPVVENDEKQRHFISVASHELRSPLAVFKTGLSILKTEPDAGKTERIFTLLDGEMSRMERLIQDLLCLAKAEHAVLDVQFQKVSLNKLVDDVCEKYILLAKERGIILCYQPAGESCDCICDPQRIEQVIVILLDNALSYTPAGGSVDLALFRSRNRYCIQVADTGTGISDADKKKIFDRFYRSSASRSSKEHFGLGLSIAGEICKIHRAKILVTDTKGGGSTFTLRLRAPGKFFPWHLENS